MPGLLSNVFADDGSVEGAGDADAQTDLDLSIDLALEVDAQTSWHSIDGTTHQWSTDNTLALDVDANAALSVVNSFGGAADDI